MDLASSALVQEEYYVERLKAYSELADRKEGEAHTAVLHLVRLIEDYKCYPNLERRDIVEVWARPPCLEIMSTLEKVGPVDQLMATYADTPPEEVVQAITESIRSRRSPRTMWNDTGTYKSLDS